MNRTIGRRALLGSIVGVAGLFTGFFAEKEYVIEDVTVEQPRDPLSLAVTAPNPNLEFDSPGVLEFSVTNEGNEAIELENRGITPFGVLDASPTDHPALGPRITSPAYEDSEHVEVSSSERNVSTTVLTETVEPGETLTTEYEVDGSQIRETGTFEIEGWEPLLTYHDPESDSEVAETSLVTFDVESRDGLLP